MTYAKDIVNIIMGESEPVYTEFRDSNNQLTTVNNPSLTIYDPEGTVVVNAVTPTEESTGVYYYNWTVTTAAANKEGLYQAFWKGTIGGFNVTQDVPRFYLVKRYPYTVGLGGEIIDDVRRFVGDDDPNNYQISQIDMHYYLQDGVARIQRDYDMGYTITVSPTSVTFNKTLTETARELFKRGAALVILEHLRHKGLWGAGSIDIGDVKVNLTNVNRMRADAVKDLKAELDKSIKGLIRMSVAGVSINTYATETLSSLTTAG